MLCTVGNDQTSQLHVCVCVMWKVACVCIVIVLVAFCECVVDGGTRLGLQMFPRVVSVSSDSEHTSSSWRPSTSLFFRHCCIQIFLSLLYAIAALSSNEASSFFVLLHLIHVEHSNRTSLTRSPQADDLQRPWTDDWLWDWGDVFL